MTALSIKLLAQESEWTYDASVPVCLSRYLA